MSSTRELRAARRLSQKRRERWTSGECEVYHTPRVSNPVCGFNPVAPWVVWQQRGTWDESDI